MKPILVIDNYDSFTFNLVEMLRGIDAQEPFVVRNDKISVADAARYERIVLSPGPGLPSEAGIMPELVKRASSRSRILGVCLGHQCIGEAFGGTLRNVGVPIHGKALPARVTVPSHVLFKGLPEKISVGRYHSWVVNADGFPPELEITAVDDHGEVMALRHRELDVHGVQFHPESILTEHGRAMLENWVRGAA